MVDYFDPFARYTAKHFAPAGSGAVLPRRDGEARENPSLARAGERQIGPTYSQDSAMSRLDSDLDHDHWLNGPDPRERDARDEEQAREERWSAFVAHLRAGRPSVLLRHVADLLDDRPDWHYEGLGLYERFRAFAETEGWPGVLNAIAQAMREADAAEVERRR